MEVVFEPRPMKLSELAAYYLPNLSQVSYRTKQFIVRLLLTDAERYLSVTRKGHKLHGLNSLTLQDVWVIIRRLGWPPFKENITEPLREIQ